MSALACALVLAAFSSAGAQGSGPLHVPSPEWTDQVVYFLMTDRFDDGDPSNNDQGKGEFDPREGGAYSGGDLAGARKRLGYIQGLGATAVWLTPPVANVWRDPALKMAGYHGYWAEDFKRLDAHLGSIDEYRALARALHGRGMFLIQDVVVNHVGDYFTYEGPYDPEAPERGFVLKAGLEPNPRPTQPPFDLNDARDPRQRAARAYHWTPPIVRYRDRSQRLSYQMSGLDDLDTSNPVVRRALRDSYGFWISTAGVDGFRFDTAAYVEHDFWRDFLHARDPEAPGVIHAARAAGKEAFLAFGEVWGEVEPFSEDGDVEASSYLGSKDAPEMTSVLNFPLAMDLRAVFAKGAPPAQLEYRLRSMARRYEGGRASVNFLDNHDMPRFRAEGSREALEQALVALFTLPGMPVVYAGTEQGFTETRASMFARGFGSGGRDGFVPSHRLYRLIARLAALRRSSPALRRGALEPLRAEGAGPGAFAYALEHAGERLVVVFNTGDEPALLAGLETGLAPGRARELFSRGGARLPSLDGRGRLTAALPARAALVLASGGGGAKPSKTGPALAIEDVRREDGAVVVEGSGPADSLVIDGRLGRAVRAARSGGRWSARFPEAALSDGPHELRALGGRASAPTASEPRRLDVRVPWRETASVDDAVGDDRGPSGAYRYPKAPGFEGRADLKRVAVLRRGADVKLVVTMARELSDAWNPVFGFDHVSFDVYVDLPARAGSVVLPRLRAKMPRGDWDYAAFLAGWKTGLYSARGATPHAFGEQVSPAPKLRVDKKAGVLEVELSAEAFAGASLDGARFYVATWDYDGAEGALRGLTAEPADYLFGGPDGPLVMDDVGPLP